MFRFFLIETFKIKIEKIKSKVNFFQIHCLEQTLQNSRGGSTPHVHIYHDNRVLLYGYLHNINPSISNP